MLFFLLMFIYSFHSRAICCEVCVYLIREWIIGMKGRGYEAVGFGNMWRIFHESIIRIFIRMCSTKMFIRIEVWGQSSSVFLGPVYMWEESERKYWGNHVWDSIDITCYIWRRGDGKVWMLEKEFKSVRIIQNIWNRKWICKIGEEL